MPELLDNPGANYLIQYDDGSVEMVSKSNMNRLIYEHGLWGLLRTGDEILVIQSDGAKPRIRVIPEEGAQSYTVEVGEYDPVHLGPHQKTDLVDALNEAKREGGDERRALMKLFDSARDFDVRRRVLNSIAEQPPFDSRVEVTDDGWLFYGHLLLTWDREFYHPNTMSKTRTGSVIGDGAGEIAYGVKAGWGMDPDGPREIVVDGSLVRLSDDEMTFITRAMWALSAAPGGR